MSIEHSFGIIPLRKKSSGDWEVLLIQHRHGHWGFPKGHSEPGETPLEASCRELKEETGLNLVKLVFSVPLVEHYDFIRDGRSVSKDVTYFIGSVEGDVSLQHEEVSHFQWILMSNASEHITFPEAKNICKQALHLLSTITSTL